MRRIADGTESLIRRSASESGVARFGTVTAVGASNGYVEITVDGYARCRTGIEVSVGDPVLWIPGPVPVIVASPLVGSSSAPASPEAIVYPPSSGTTIQVSPTDNVQTVLNSASNYDTIVLPEHDFTDDATIWEFPTPVYMYGQGVGLTKTPRLKSTAAMSWLWLSGLTVERTTTVDASTYRGFESTGGIIDKFRFFDLEFTGHGLNDAFLIRTNYANDRGVIHNVEVHEIENRGGTLACENLRTWGLYVHDLYRTIDINTGDVDAFRIFGEGHHHSGFHFNLDTADSISTESAGRANPSGPLGSYSAPHSDAWQFFHQAHPTNASGSWNIGGIIENGVANFQNGDQFFIGQSQDPSSFPVSPENLIFDMTIRGNVMVGISTALIFFYGSDGTTVENNIIWLKEPSPTTYRAVEYGTYYGEGTNLNATVASNTVYKESASQSTYYSPSSVTDTPANTETVGDPPDLGIYNTVTLERPTETEVLAWLQA